MVTLRTSGPTGPGDGTLVWLAVPANLAAETPATSSHHRSDL